MYGKDRICWSGVLLSATHSLGTMHTCLRSQGGWAKKALWGAISCGFPTAEWSAVLGIPKAYALLGNPLSSQGLHFSKPGTVDDFMLYLNPNTESL